MPNAVVFDRYGPVDVLKLVEVARPTPGSDQVLVEVAATSINPGEILIREGGFAETAPSTFPSGQGSDLAGRVVEVGDQTGDWAVGDEVIGWTDERSAQADFVTVPADQLTRRPPSVSWEQAGSLYVAGGTAVGMADGVPATSGETAVVFGATGGVGSILTQLLINNGVRVLSVAGPANDDWVRSVGAEPVHYGDGLERRLREAAPLGINAAYDAFGAGYVELAVGLGVATDRVITIIDFDAAERAGAKTVFGHQVTSADALAHLAGLIESGELTIPIAATFPLARVREAYRQLAERHSLGKIVLLTPAG
jgi:NADPH2:quinone reductase